MLLDVGDKVHVIERRLFDSDVRRHFFGEIERVDSSAIRVTGHVFVFDSRSSTYIRNTQLRTRIIPLAAGGYVINVAPPDINVDDVRYVERDGRLVATDGGEFNLDINEFGGSR